MRKVKVHSDELNNFGVLRYDAGPVEGREEVSVGQAGLPQGGIALQQGEVAATSSAEEEGLGHVGLRLLPLDELEKEIDLGSESAVKKNPHPIGEGGDEDGVGGQGEAD